MQYPVLCTSESSDTTDASHNVSPDANYLDKTDIIKGEVLKTCLKEA